MVYLEFPVRFCQMPKAGFPNSEEYFQEAERILRLKVDETAFVLIDVWDMSRVPKRLVTKSHFSRAREITEKRIKPALEAARRIHLPIIHAPSSYVAVKYPQYLGLKEKLGVPTPEKKPPKWPPQAFVRERWREFNGDRLGERVKDDEVRRSLTYIPEVVKPLDGEFIVATGEEMNEILRQKGVLNLIYVGFATNMCLLNKPGALLEMAHHRGYRTIVLRECTTAMENRETLPDLLMTKVFLQWIEMMALAYTASYRDFIEACEKASMEMNKT